MQLKLKDEYAERVTWSRPDALVGEFCSLCGTQLEDDMVPTQLWKDDGSAVQFCDRCASQVIEVVQ